MGARYWEGNCEIVGTLCDVRCAVTSILCITLRRDEMGWDGIEYVM